MSSIFASKFYASNQTKIQTAVNDPKNRELVQQVASYLSKEDQAKLASMIKEEKKDREGGDVSEQSFEDPGMSGGPSHGGAPMSFGHSNMGGGASSFGDLSDDLGDLPDGGDTIADVDEAPNPEATPEPDVDSSTKIYQMGSNKVIAATQTTEELTEEGIQELLAENEADGEITGKTAESIGYITYQDKFSSEVE